MNAGLAIKIEVNRALREFVWLLALTFTITLSSAVACSAQQTLEVPAPQQQPPISLLRNPLLHPRPCHQGTTYRQFLLHHRRIMVANALPP